MARTISAAAAVNDNRMAELVAKTRELGAAEGKGVSSRIELASQVCFAAKDGVLNLAKGSTDVKDLWCLYVASRAEAKGETKDRADASLDQQVAKLNAFAKLGASPRFDGFAVFELACEMCSKHSIKGGTYDNVLTVAREQLKLDTPLDEAGILAVLQPDAKPAKGELEHFKRLLKQIERIEKGANPTDASDGEPGYASPELAAAKRAVNARIADLTA